MANVTVDNFLSYKLHLAVGPPAGCDSALCCESHFQLVARCILLFSISSDHHHITFRQSRCLYMAYTCAAKTKFAYCDKLLGWCPGCPPPGVHTLVCFPSCFASIEDGKGDGMSLPYCIASWLPSCRRLSPLLALMK